MSRFERSVFTPPVFFFFFKFLVPFFVICCILTFSLSAPLPHSQNPLDETKSRKRKTPHDSPSQSLPPVTKRARLEAKPLIDFKYGLDNATRFVFFFAVCCLEPLGLILLLFLRDKLDFYPNSRRKSGINQAFVLNHRVAAVNRSQRKPYFCGELSRVCKQLRSLKKQLNDEVFHPAFETEREDGSRSMISSHLSAVLLSEMKNRSLCTKLQSFVTEMVETIPFFQLTDGSKNTIKGSKNDWVLQVSPHSKGSPIHRDTLLCQIAIGFGQWSSPFICAPNSSSLPRLVMQKKGRLSSWRMSCWSPANLWFFPRTGCTRDSLPTTPKSLDDCSPWCFRSTIRKRAASQWSWTPKLLKVCCFVVNIRLLDEALWFCVFFLPCCVLFQQCATLVSVELV